jgi:hypothetical protein
MNDGNAIKVLVEIHPQFTIGINNKSRTKTETHAKRTTKSIARSSMVKSLLLITLAQGSPRQLRPAEYPAEPRN